MIEKIMHNWTWKLLSIVLAFVLWLVVVNYQDPLETETFENIPVQKINELAITSKSQAIEYKDGETVDVILRGKRSIIDKLTADDIKAYADLGKVSITNAVDIAIDVNEQIEVLKKEPSKMIIALEKITTVLRDVQVFYDGTLADSYIKLEAIVTPNQIEITGPESKLNMIASVIAPIKIENRSEDVTVSVTPKLLDSQNEEVLGLTLGTQKVDVQVPIQKIKTVPLVFQTIGVMNENYRLDELKLSMTQVTLRGEAEDLDKVSRLVVTGIDLATLANLEEPLIVDLRDYIPQNIYLYDTDYSVEVLVDIKPLVEQSFTIEHLDINVRYLPENLQFKYLTEESYEIILKGVAEELALLKVEDLRPYISVYQLEAGKQMVELQFIIPSGFERVSDIPQINIDLLPVEEGTTDNQTTN